MKKIVAFLLLFVMVFSIVACDNSKKTSSNNSNSPNLMFKTLKASSKNVYGKVSNSTTTFSFIDEVVPSENTTFKVFLDMHGKTEIPTKKVSLNVGDNIFYLLSKNGTNESLYTVTIRRRTIYTVRLTDNNDTAVSDRQYVEEDGFLHQPIDPQREGYDFLGWNTSFPVKITGDTSITSNWKTNWEKILEYENNTVKGFRTLITIYYGFSKEVYIPAKANGVAVTNIGDRAFIGDDYIKYVEIPDTVTYIGERAFKGCLRLNKVVLSQNLEYIGEEAFDDCTSLTTIVFNGTTSDWNNISKDLNWNDDVPAEYVQCIDGKVDI